MAQYKYGQYLKQKDHSAYDTKYSPGQEAINPGIYRCVACGDEIAIAKVTHFPHKTIISINLGQEKSSGNFLFLLSRKISE
ncbi:hypothetical protein [Aquipseudomonas campi]